MDVSRRVHVFVRGHVQVLGHGIALAEASMLMCRMPLADELGLGQIYIISYYNMMTSGGLDWLLCNCA